MIIPVVILIFIGLAFLSTLPTMFLVNYIFAPAVLETVFGGPLDFWKALALNVLFAILFSNMKLNSKGK